MSIDHTEYVHVHGDVPHGNREWRFRFPDGSIFAYAGSYVAACRSVRCAARERCEDYIEVLP